MPDKSKSPIALFIVIILISLSLAGAGFYLLQKEKVSNSALQRNLENLNTKEKVATTRLEEYKKTIAQLELKLEEAQANINALTNNLQEEKDAKQKAQDQLQKLQADLEQQKGLRLDLETKLSGTQKKLEETTVRLNGLESKKAQLEAKIKSLEEGEGVELGTIVVGPEETQAGSVVEPALGQPKERTATSLVGKVLVLNKDYDFVVVNLGSKDGVNIGDVFSLYHNDRYIGDVKVAKIHDSMSAADFLSSDIKNQVSEGDRAVQKTE